MKRNVLMDGNGSDTVMIEGLGAYVPMSQVRSMQAELERLQSLAGTLKQEAECHAQEARTQRSTVLEIYQALGIQKGDWNGKVPVVEKFEAVEQERDQLKVEVKRLDAAIGEEIRNRDSVEAHADRLAAGIAKALGIDIGEHSSMNCPWHNAFFAIDEFDLAGHDADVIERKAKPIATEFFRWWYNQPGSNTDQGFDEWWQLRQQAKEVQSEHSKTGS